MARSPSSTSGSRDGNFWSSDKPTIADVSMAGYLYYPAEEFGFDIAKEHPAIGAWLERMQGAAGLEASLRPDAGLSLRHARIPQSVIVVVRVVMRRDRAHVNS